MTPVRRFLHRFAGERRGSILAETAITVSVLAMFSLAGVEVGRYALLHQKMERVAASIGDLIAQAPTLSETDVDNVFAAIGEVAKPFEMGPNGLVIISSISLDSGGTPVLNWQRADGGLSGSSEIGQTGGPATLPQGLTVASGDTVITAEVKYAYTPWLYARVVGASEIYHTAFFRPRQGTLTSITP